MQYFCITLSHYELSAITYNEYPYVTIRMKIKIRKACFRVLDKNGFLLLYAKSRVIVYIENNWTYHIDNALSYIPEEYDALIIMIGLLLPWNYCFSYDGIYDTMLFT